MGSWSNFGNFTAEDSAHFPSPFPPYPIQLVHLSVSGIAPSPLLTKIEVDIRGKGGVVLQARLFRGNMGLMITEIGQADGPVFWTLKQYNKWKYFDHFPTAATAPQKLQVVGRFIGGSDDIDEWAEGVSALLRTGFRGVSLPSTAPLGNILKEIADNSTGMPPLFAGGIYSPPGGAFDFNLGNSSADVDWKLDTWANKTASAYRLAGFNLSMASDFALADEPGWYFPSILKTTSWPPRVMQSWISFLQENASLTLADLGASSWDEVLPIGRSSATTLPLRRQYYWSCRFFSIYSAQHFAAVTRVMEKHFHSNMLVFAK
jgi:hypothetical protein